MNNSTLSSAMLLLALGTAIAPSTGQTSASTATAPPEIAADYQQMDKGAAQLDPNPILKCYASGAIFMDMMGKTTTLAQMGPKLHDDIVHAQSSASRTAIKSVDVQPDGVTVTVQRHIDQTDINPRTKVLDTTIMDYTERDHWVQLGGKWKINRSRALAMSMMFNGRPYTGPM